jgi:hypothetical protein
MKTITMVLMMGMMTVQAEIVGGPKGGKLLDNTAPRAEFFVNAENRVEIQFYNDAMEPVAAGDQVVNVIAQVPEGRVTMDMVTGDGHLVSANPLPEGDGYMIVVSIKQNAEAKPQNFRITLHLEKCEGCNRAEYACTCDHAGEEQGHSH